jgi:hypothetical protein
VESVTSLRPYSQISRPVVHRPEFEIQENSTFRKVDLFSTSSEGRETPTLLGPLESGPVIEVGSF